MLPRLVESGDIRGLVHIHTTDSDGAENLRDMAIRGHELGFAYLAVSDHSRSAFYARGLEPERLLEQGRRIDRLNEELCERLDGFRILKGVESDILRDGSLDYQPEILETLLQPFVSTKENGFGIGLAISETIVKNHGGRIHAANLSDDGALVEVRIPVIRAGDRK